MSKRSTIYHQYPVRKIAKSSATNENSSHEGELEHILLTKKCKCKTTEHIASLKRWLCENSQLHNFRMKQLLTLFENLNTGSQLERADKIFNYLFSSAQAGKISYVVCSQLMCYDSFRILFCSNNMLTKTIIPAIKAGVRPSLMKKVAVNDDDNDINNQIQSYFSQSTTAMHFKAYFETIQNDCMTKSSPIDGFKWLPTCYTSKDVFESYQKDAKQLNIQPYSSKTFFTKWKTDFGDVRIREDVLRCETCQKLENNTALEQDINKKREMKRKLKLHLEEAKTARDYFNSIKLKYKSHSKRLLVCGDGGDSFGLPRFRVTPKTLMARNTLQTSCYMMRMYCKAKADDRIRAFYYNDYAVGECKSSGVAIECFYRVLCEEGLLEGKLKNHTVYCCADNTSKETKNYYFLGFLHNLVASGLVKSIQYFNLLVGHTHFEVDQAIGVDKKHIRKQNIATMDQLMENLNANTRAVKNYNTQILSECHDWRTAIAKHYKQLTNLTGYVRIIMDKVVVLAGKDWNGDLEKVRSKKFAKDAITEQITADIAPPSDFPMQVLKNIPTFVENIADENAKK